MTKENSNGKDSSENLSEVDTLKAELEKVRNDYLYLKADFENYKRNARKEHSDLVKYGGERLAADLLNVLDIMETALQTEVSIENFKSFKDGIVMTANELRQVFSRHGITKVDSLGKPFDPAIHEALGDEEAPKTPPGHISRVYKPAYKYHDKIIRPGQVVVARDSSSGSGSKES